MRYLVYCFRETKENLFDYRALSVVALVTSAFSMLCFGLFFLVYVNIQEIVQSFEEKITIRVYLNDKISRDELTVLESKLRAHSEVSNVYFVSREDAMKAYLLEYPSQEEVLRELGDQVLPQSFVVELSELYRTIAGVTAMGVKIVKIDGVEDVRYGKEWIEVFSSVNRVLILVSMLFGMTLVFAVIAIVANTMRLVFFNRRDDIDVLRLLGATESFIKGPFLLEGAILGGLGAALSLVLLKIVFEAFSYRIGDELFQGQSILFVPFTVLVGMIACGAILGFIGALFSLRRTYSV